VLLFSLFRVKPILDNADRSLALSGAIPSAIVALALGEPLSISRYPAIFSKAELALRKLVFISRLPATFTRAESALGKLVLISRPNLISLS